MPELAEVETARRSMDVVLNREITAVSAEEQGGHARHGQFDDIFFEGAAQTAIEKALLGRKIMETGRRGKQMFWKLDNSSVAGVHFGMSGHIDFKTKDAKTWPPTHTKLLIEFDGGSVEMAVCDTRRLGRFVLAKTVRDIVGDLAPDAYAELPSAKSIFDTLSKSGSVAIKTTLLDQRALVAGIGNWMADDVLLLAGIHPEAKTNSLSQKQCKDLHSAISSVCRTAVDVGADQTRLPLGYLFHIRWDADGKRGLTTKDGKRVSICKVGGRTTLFVPAAQSKTGEREADAAEASESADRSPNAEPQRRKRSEKQTKEEKKDDKPIASDTKRQRRHR